MAPQTSADLAEILTRKYHMNCKRFNLTPSIDGMVRYLMVHQVIPERVIQKYMVLEMYPKELYQHNNKTEAVQHLADITGVCERTVWYLLQEQKNQFCPTSAG